MRSFDIVMSAHLDHSDHVASTGHSNRSGIFQSMSSSSWGCLSWLTCFFPSNLHSTPPSQWIPIMCFILGQYTGTRFICQLHWFHFIPKLCKDFAGGNFLLRKGMVRAAFDVLFSHVRTHTIRSQAGIVYNGLSVHTDVHLFLQPNNACVVMESRLSTWKDEQFCSIRIKWIRRLSIEHAKCVGVWQLVNDNNISTFLMFFWVPAHRFEVDLDHFGVRQSGLVAACARFCQHRLANAGGTPGGGYPHGCAVWVGFYDLPHVVSSAMGCSMNVSQVIR